MPLPRCLSRCLIGSVLLGTPHASGFAEDISSTGPRWCIRTRTGSVVTSAQLNQYLGGGSTTATIPRINPPRSAFRCSSGA
jgi:hypothetical protein